MDLKIISEKKIFFPGDGYFAKSIIGGTLGLKHQKIFFFTSVMGQHLRGLGPVLRVPSMPYAHLQAVITHELCGERAAKYVDSTSVYKTRVNFGRHVEADQAL